MLFYIYLVGLVLSCIYGGYVIYPRLRERNDSKVYSFFTTLMFCLLWFIFMLFELYDWIQEKNQKESILLEED